MVGVQVWTPPQKEKHFKCWFFSRQKNGLNTVLLIILIQVCLADSKYWVVTHQMFVNKFTCSRIVVNLCRLIKENKFFKVYSFLLMSYWVTLGIMHFFN